MQWLFYISLSLVWAVAQALSTSGDRVLVVLEELGERSKYSKFWSDLEGEHHRPPPWSVINLFGACG